MTTLGQNCHDSIIDCIWFHYLNYDHTKMMTTLGQNCHDSGGELSLLTELVIMHHLNWHLVLFCHSLIMSILVIVHNHCEQRWLLTFLNIVILERS